MWKQLMYFAKLNEVLFSVILAVPTLFGDFVDFQYTYFSVPVSNHCCQMGHNSDRKWRIYCETFRCGLKILRRLKKVKACLILQLRGSITECNGWLHNTHFLSAQVSAASCDSNHVLNLPCRISRAVCVTLPRSLCRYLSDNAHASCSTLSISQNGPKISFSRFTCNFSSIYVTPTSGRDNSDSLFTSCQTKSHTEYSELSTSGKVPYIL